MAVKLNLLPQEAVIAPGFGKTLSTIKTVGIVGLAVFLFFALGITGFLIYSSLSLQALTTQQANLKIRIKTQETTEQKMVLLKDRLAKISTVKSSPSIQKDLSQAGSLLASLPVGVALSELNLDQKKTDMSLIFATSSDLNSFLAFVKTKTEFKRATLTAFSFNPLNGYTLSLRFFDN